MSSTPCVHLNALINPPTNSDPMYESTHKYAGTNVDRSYYDSGAGFVIPKGIENRSYEYQFRRKMEKAGLEPIAVDIFVLRFIYDMSFREISLELGIVSTSTVYRLYEEAKYYLQKTGLPHEVD